MAKTETNNTVAKTKAEIVKTSDALDLNATQDESTTPVEKVNVCCSMQRGIKFSGLTTVKGGVYAIPGINANQRGKNGAILATPGGSTLIRVPRPIWEEIKQKYGTLNCFTHQPPFLRELKSEKDYSSKTLQSELKEVRTGMEPANPASDLSKSTKA